MLENGMIIESFMANNKEEWELKSKKILEKQYPTLIQVIPSLYGKFDGVGIYIIEEKDGGIVSPLGIALDGKLKGTTINKINGKNERGNEKMSKWELLNKEQKEIGEELKKLLMKKYDRVEIIQANLGFETFERGIGVNIYVNKYDYKEINLKYPIDATAQDYYETVVYAMELKKWNREHNSIPEERFIIDLIEKYECNNMTVVFDELRSFNSEDTIAIAYINNLKMDFENKIMEIEEQNEGVFMVDFKDETIEMIKSFDDEEESMEQAKKQCRQEEIEQKEKDWRMEHIRICPKCGSEMCDMKPNNAGILEESDWSCDICGWENKGITIELIEKIIKSFNDRNCWCTLSFNRENETIYIQDKEANDNCVTELVALDDINEIFLKEDKLCIDYNEDKNGFDYCEINEYGIEY